MTVRLLEEHVVNQIAAGEVVERPASVVKELVENALDAGATLVDVLLQDGGRQRIRVRDDGIGMNEPDALMALERHATSKIRHAEDLADVGTLGFRGEALPSIASVSRFTLVSRTAADESAIQLRVEGGTLTDVRRVGAPVGTEVDVRSLFFNVPARRKFLRTAETELAHVMETVSRVALMRPDVDFGVRHGERVLLRAPVGDHARRAGDVLGPDGRKLVAVDAHRGDVRVVGLASRPGDGRTSAAGALYLYVNGRWVKDVVLRRAVYQAYRDLVPKGRYPLVVLDVQLPRDQVDVNVHPTKAEVRFVNPRDLTAVVAEELRAAVLGGQSDPRHRPARGGYEIDRPSLPLQVAWASPSPPALPPHPDDAPLLVHDQPPAPPAPSPAAPAAAVPAAPLEPEVAPPRPGLRLRDRRLVGVLRARWLLLEDDDGLLVVDGGRAAMALGLAAGGSARRLVPARVTLGPADVEAVLAADRPLSALGLELARFGPREVAVKAVPPALTHADPALLVGVAADALRRGADVARRWVELVPPGEIEADEHAVRTLMASVDEAGVPVASRRLGWDELP